MLMSDCYRWQWVPVVLAPWLVACGAEDEDPLACEAAAKRVDEFVADASNQACEDDADCVVVVVDCAPTNNDFCGQVGMTRSAYDSPRWREIEASLASCPDSCETCLAALEPRCSEGSCYRPADPSSTAAEDGG